MDKKLLSLISLFFLTFGIFAGVVVFNKPLTQFTRAKEDVLPSPDTSLILAWPLEAAADGKTDVMVSVFVRTVTNKPVGNKVVTATTNHGTIREASQTTNAEGKAVFTLTADSPGVAEVAATVDGETELSQKVSVKFE
jgi:hypothetical protein